MITIFFIILAIVLCYGIYNFNVDTHDQKQFDDMAQTVALKDDEETDSGVESLMSENPDCIGWVRISGTKIDYPIMQTKNNPQYYLRRGFDRQYSYLGTPFMDARCDVNYDNNFIVYGHNMKDGKMFADLLKFKDKSYCNEHNVIQLNINGKTYNYELYAVCKIKDNDDWYGYTCQTDKEAFNNLISHVKNKSLYLSEDEIQYGDYFLTLSTCEYSQSNGRFILIAKKK